MITAEEAKRFLSYDPETGIFRWKVDRTSTIKSGHIAGGKDRFGYVEIRLSNRLYKAHRLAWLVSYGIWPSGVIDHINGLKGDNRLSNLRDVSHAENLQNLRRARSDSSTGILGVRKAATAGKYISEICLQGKRVHLGTFDSISEAQAAYLEKKRLLHRCSTI